MSAELQRRSARRTAPPSRNGGEIGKQGFQSAERLASIEPQGLSEGLELTELPRSIRGEMRPRMV